jgi:hypothetical protein
VTLYKGIRVKACCAKMYNFGLTYVYKLIFVEVVMMKNF